MLLGPLQDGLRIAVAQCELQTERGQTVGVNRDACTYLGSAECGGEISKLLQCFDACGVGRVAFAASCEHLGV